MEKMTWFENGGVTSPRGFNAAGVHAGIKAARLDMALIVSDRPAVMAGMFTRNRIQAAPVKLCRARLTAGRGRAIIINSGSANACTGARGLKDAGAMAQLTAQALRCDARSVFMCSTGTIGKPLPMDKIARGIQLAVAALSPTGGDTAAHAIMTTDTVPKHAAVEVKVDGITVRIGGMAKGAGMISPSLATMLVFLTTDAVVGRPALQACLRDAVLLMANGAAGNRPLRPGHKDWPVFVAAMRWLTRELAAKIVKDGEGATKFVTVTVKGARTGADADRAARAVANSLLVKTSWFGMDPNWGRVIAAVGYSGAAVRDDKVSIDFEGVPAVKGGCIAPGFSLEQLEAILQRPAFEIVVDLHLGRGCATVYTCDCSEEYVRINASYLT